MKRRVLALVLGLAMALVPVGCGSAAESESADAETTESTEAEDTADAETDAEESEEEIPIVDDDSLTWKDCLTLGQYEGLELTKTITPVTDEDVEDSIENSASAEEVTDEDAEVVDGDTVDIAYEGKLDGVAFEGGTSDSYQLVIGSDTFIDGFEDGIIGMKVGETKDLNLTFPEDYSSEDLAGQEVVFTVTVNGIYRTPELTDEWVKEYTNGSSNTIDEYKEVVRESLEQDNEQNAIYSLQSSAWSTVMENTEFSQIPKSYVDKAKEEYRTSFEEQAESYGYEFDDFLEANGYDEDSFEELLDEYGMQIAKTTLLLEALCDTLGIDKDSQEFADGMETLAQAYGSDEETLRSNYGDETVDRSALTAAVMKVLVDKANVTEEEAEADTTE